jgi:hypothetical protein
VLVSVASGASAQKSGDLSITLGPINQEVGLTQILPATTTPVPDLGGRPAISTQAPGDPSAAGYLSLALVGSLSTPPAPPPADVWVTVEYYDKGTDTFDLEYDRLGSGTDSIYFAGVAGQQTVVKTDSKQWLTRSFHLLDPAFTHREDGGADLRISDNGDGREALHLVYVSKTVPSPFRIKSAADAITIDGNLTEATWKDRDGGVFTFNRLSQDLYLPDSRSNWTGPSDLSGDARFSFDKDYFYVGATVVDDTANNTSQFPSLFEGDSIEVYLGLDNSNPGRTGYLVGSDFQITLAAKDDPEWQVDMGGALGVPSVDPGPVGANAARKRTDSGYVLEARIPWAVLSQAAGVTVTPPSLGTTIGFDVHVNDGDSTSTQENTFSLSGIPRGWRDPYAWTAAVLEPGKVLYKGDANLDNSVTIADVMLSLRFALNLAKPTDDQKVTADANKDGKLNIADVMLILSAALKRLPLQPA